MGDLGDLGEGLGDLENYLVALEKKLVTPVDTMRATLNDKCT